MKIKKILTTSLAVIIGVLLNTSAAAQTTKEEYRIKIIKEENGKKQMIDTVFSNKADFEAFHKANVSNHEYYDMLTHKMINGKKKDYPAMGKKKDCPFSKYKYDSLSGKHMKVIKIEMDEDDMVGDKLEKIYNAEDGKEILKVLNIDIDSIIGDKEGTIKVVSIYSRIEVKDAPLSVVENSTHPQMKSAAKDKKLVLKGVNVYPNPSNGKVFLDIETGQPGEIELLVTDLQGKEIFSDKFYNDSPKLMQRNINIDGHSSGVYLLKITSQGKSVVKKLIFE